jgi:hypothetical protein
MRLIFQLLSSSFVLQVCLASVYYGLMLEQHAESAWEQQFNMRVDVVARMASSFAEILQPLVAHLLNQSCDLQSKTVPGGRKKVEPSALRNSRTCP